MHPHFEKPGASSPRSTEPTLALALAALLHKSPDEHAAGTVGRRLRYTNREIERATWLLSHLPIIRDAPQIFWPRLQRVLVHEAQPSSSRSTKPLPAPTIPRSPSSASGSPGRPTASIPLPLIDGSDLIRHGLAPSPDFARLLEVVRDAQLHGEIETELGAMTLVQRILDGEYPDGQIPEGP